MSTTVFPVTDQTVTVSLWASMQDALDRGDTDPFANTSDYDHDSERLTAGGTASASVTSTADVTLATIPIDEGMTFAGVITVQVSRVDNGGSGSDAFQVRVNVPSGIRLTGVCHSQSNFTGTSGTLQAFDVSGATSGILSINGGVFTDEKVVHIYVAAVGDTGTGNILVYGMKGTDSDADNYLCEARVILRRIL